jgi:hypothetical protein
MRSAIGPHVYRDLVASGCRDRRGIKVRSEFVGFEEPRSGVRSGLICLRILLVTKSHFSKKKVPQHVEVIVRGDLFRGAIEFIPPR